MRKIKLFEQYKSELHKNLNTVRHFQNTKLINAIGKIASFIDDIIHFNFGLVSYSMKNQSGYNKLSELIKELSILKVIVQKSDDDLDFEDMYRYGLNDKVLLYLDDDDVKEYLTQDTKLFNRLYTHEYMNIFSEYSDWKNQNGLNESFNFKTINYHSCDNCNELFKTKKNDISCPNCGSKSISSMEEVDWYKQVN